MTTNETHNMAVERLKYLKKLLKKELQKKALLGQYVIIINCDGKACRVAAKDTLIIAEGK